MINIYQLTENSEEFEKIELEENKALFELLDSNKILVFVDMNHGRVWTWNGKRASPKMKFLSAQITPKLRDKYDIAYSINSVDEGEETSAFKILVGLV